MFVQMCILAGCDYCDSVHGIGLVKAQEAVARFKHVADDRRLERIVAYFKGQGKKVPEGFLARVKRAELLFHYHPVYCPRTKSVRPLMDYAPSSSSSSSSSDSSDAAADEGSEEPKEWMGPSVSVQEMRALGLGAEAELLTIGSLRAPTHVTAQGLCEASERPLRGSSAGFDCGYDPATGLTATGPDALHDV
jgi:ribosomal protein L44E